MKKSNPIYIVLPVFITLLVIVGGMILPQLLLTNYSNSTNNIITSIDSSQYVGDNSATAALASSQLTEYERLRLITNLWEGDSFRVDARFSEEDAYSMYTKVKQELHRLYKSGLYPVAFLEGDGDNWYSWTASRYCCTDSTFHSFSAYYWVIELYKYNHAEHHTVLISETGTILYAESTSTRLASINDISRKYTVFSIINQPPRPHSYIELDRDTVLPNYREIKIPQKRTSVGAIVVGDDSITSLDMLNDSYSVNNGNASSSNEYYYVFQSREGTDFAMHYTIGILPYVP